MAEDAVALLENSRGWRELVTAFDSGRVPQSFAAIVPGALQKLFAERFGKLVLGDSPLWESGEHPDVINAGKFMTPPGIDECRALQGELALHPLAAAKRLAVIWAADKLSPDAENSLLKITEEPPVDGCVLFISEEDRLLPTIKSRVWSIYIELPEEYVQSSRYPASPEEWAEWLESGKKAGTDGLFIEMESWVKFMTEHGDFRGASNLETLIRLMEQKRMSLPMVQDLAYAVIKEGVPCEEIFSSLR